MSLSTLRKASLVGLAATTFLAGCVTAPTTPEVEKAPPTNEDALVPVSDKSVMLYSGREEALVAPLIEAFSKQTGISVDVRYAGTAELAAQLLEEGAQTPAGVFLSQDAGALGALSDAGLFQELPVTITSRVEAEFRSLDDSWVGVTGRARVIVYDSQVVSPADLPNTSEEIVDSKWAGLVAVAPGNASFQSFVTALRVIRGETEAEQWVENLAENNPQIFEKNAAILEAVNDNDGDHPLGLTNHYYWFRLAEERGGENLRVQVHFPEAGDPASIVNVTGAGVLKAHNEDQDAYDLVKFLVSDEAQQYFVDVTFEYPLVPGIQAPAGLPALADLTIDNFDLSDLRSLQTTQGLLQKYGLIL